MATFNGTRLPFDIGSLTVRGDGVIVIRRPEYTYAAYPFAQPQPYYERESREQGGASLTTNGVALLRSVTGDVSHAVLVRASLDLLCALTITPDALTMEDVMDLRLGRDQRLIMAVTSRPRFGLLEGSHIVFHEEHRGISMHDISYLDDDLRETSWR